MRSPFAGRLIAGVEKDMRVNRDGQLAFIEVAGEGPQEGLRTDHRLRREHAPGLVSRSDEGQKLAVLLPEMNQVWRALRGLYLVGQKVDIERIERGAEGSSGSRA